MAALPGCDPDDAVAMAERLRVEVMHAPFHLKTTSLTVRASFGVAQSRGRSPLLVLREAETALADAKRSGRDRVRPYGLELLAKNGMSAASNRLASGKLFHQAQLLTSTNKTQHLE